MRENIFTFSIDSLELNIFFILDNIALLKKLFKSETGYLESEKGKEEVYSLTPIKENNEQLNKNIKKIGETFSKLALKLKISPECFKEYQGLARFAANERIFLNIAKIFPQKIEFQALGSWAVASEGGQISPSGSFLMWNSELKNIFGLRDEEIKKEDFNCFLYPILTCFNIKDPESQKDNCLIFSSPFDQTFTRYFMKDKSIVTISLKWGEKLLGAHVSHYFKEENSERSFFFLSSFMSQHFLGKLFPGKDNKYELNENDKFIEYAQEKIFPAIKEKMQTLDKKLSFDSEFDTYCSLDNILQKL